MDDWILKWPVSFWTRNFRFRFFEPKRLVIVQGASNLAQHDVKETSQLPLLRRKGGGGTVVLGPGMIVLTMGLLDPHSFETTQWGLRINQLWMQALGSLMIGPLSIRGLGDVTIGDRKVIGISLYRKGPLVIYQGSLLVNFDYRRIEETLNHPLVEPDYRQGRSHSDFLTSLAEQGVTYSVSEIIDHCQRYFSRIESLLVK